MPPTGTLNKIWEAVSGNMRPAWDFASKSSSFGLKRTIYRTINKADRPVFDYTTRALAGAITGGIVGGAWGAASDKESIISGAMKGAFVGATARTGMRYANRYFGKGESFLGGRMNKLRGLNRFTQSRDIRKNLRTAWNTMSTPKNIKMRNWMLGVGLFGATRGMLSGEDNPVGGAISGAIAGGIQGAALYGGGKGIQAWRGRK